METGHMVRIALAALAALIAQAICAPAALAICPPGTGINGTGTCITGSPECCRRCAPNMMSRDGGPCVPCDPGFVPNRAQAACIGLLKPTLSPRPVGAGIIDNSTGSAATGPAGAGTPLGTGTPLGSGSPAGAARSGAAGIR